MHINQQWNKYSRAGIVIAGVTISQVMAYFAVVFRIELLKPASQIIIILLITLALGSLWKLRHQIKLQGILIFSLVYFLLPISHNLFNAVLRGDVKSYTDSVFVFGAHFLLTPLAIYLSVFSSRYPIRIPLSYISILILPIGILLMLFGRVDGEEVQTIGFGHIAMNCVFIPIGFLAMISKNDKFKIIGWLSIALVLYTSGIVWSRSYTLLGVYMALLGFWYGFLKKGNSFKILTSLILAVSFIAIIPKFIGVDNEIRSNSNTLEKFKIDSLVESFNKTVQTGEIKYLYYWEGNSRADILVDAFGDFNLLEWTLGRGVFGIYESFTSRNTIEIAIAQVAFWYGIFYCIFYYGIMIYAWFCLKYANIPKSNIYIFRAVIIIRLLDSFVWGRLASTTFDLLVLTAIAAGLGVRFIPSNKNKNTGVLINKMA